MMSSVRSMSVEPTANCPYCDAVCYAAWVDIGFGPYSCQCGPFYCEECGASQIGPNDLPRELTPDEKKFDWYAPGAPIGSSVNAVNGVPVDHDTAMFRYRNGLHLDPVLTRDAECADDPDPFSDFDDEIF